MPVGKWLDSSMQVGTLVKLKHFDIEMLVEMIDAKSGDVHVTWFDKQDRICTAFFDPSLLEVVLLAKP